MIDSTVLTLLCLLFVLTPRIVRGRKGAAMFGIGWLLVLAIASIALSVVSALLAPKPKGPKPPSASDIDDPTNDAGRDMMVVFGEGVVKSPNILGFGDKAVRTYQVNA
jgi:predicted phage tail protein